MKPKIRRDDYIKKLLQDRDREVVELDVINQRNISRGEGLTSPASAVSTEETRILMEYMEQQNLFNLTSTDKNRRKVLTLKKFFKKKRNQQVEVYSCSGQEVIYTEGKVTAIGRNFVMLSNLKDRFWIPYHAIDSANIPYGIPNYSNTHQHYIYDNDLRSKLLLQFGETVSKKEELFQQFCEDSIQSNLQTWKGSRVEVQTAEGRDFTGKILETKENKLYLKQAKDSFAIELDEITYIRSLRLLHMAKNLLKNSRKS
jgi:ribosome maturation factor RimP